MSVSLKWWLAGRRFATVSKGMLTALALTAAAGLTASPAPAASFDDVDETESVLLHDSEHMKLVAEPPAAAPPAAEMETGESSAAMMIAGCTDLTCTTGLSEGCVRASGQSCSCSECNDADGLINRIRSYHSGKMIDSDPLGLVQRLGRLHDKTGACWSGRADALILFRNSPNTRPLYTFNPDTSGVALDASQLESPATAGPRLQLFRKDQCGRIWEAGYLYSGQFVSQRTLPLASEGYLTAAPGIYGNDSPPINFLDTATARLAGSLQSAELNRRWCLGRNVQFLAGFRWFQWYESIAINDAYGLGTPNVGEDIYATNTTNNLTGGQIGLDALIWQHSATGFRTEGLVKAGAYANNVSQTSSYQQFDTGELIYANTVGATGYPATCSFVGEVGLTGVLPINRNWDFRFGYVGFWLDSIAQPSDQLSGQTLAQGEQVQGSTREAGLVVLQGVSLGLEGRW
ncbi:MAG: BBP7 family outer membrane beta-barrel protein [Planctomycetia bacterium]